MGEDICRQCISLDNEIKGELVVTIEKETKTIDFSASAREFNLDLCKIYGQEKMEEE